MFTVIKVTNYNTLYQCVSITQQSINTSTATVFVEILRAAIINKYLPAIIVQSIQLSAFLLQPRFNNEAATVLNSTGFIQEG